MHYKDISVRINSILLASRKDYKGKLVDGADVKKFYSYVDSKLHTRTHNNTLKDSCGDIINNHLTIATMFNGCFAGAFTVDNLTTPLSLPDQLLIFPPSYFLPPQYLFYWVS